MWFCTKNEEIEKWPCRHLSFTQNLTILEEKIAAIRSGRTGKNGEFQNEFEEIPLTIQIEVKIRAK